jgi:hypothetical protein
VLPPYFNGPVRAELRCALGHRLGATDLDLAAGSEGRLADGVPGHGGA